MSRGFSFFCRFLLVAVALSGAYLFARGDAQVRERERSRVLFEQALSGEADQQVDVLVGGFTGDEFRVVLALPWAMDEPPAWVLARDWAVAVQTESGAGAATYGGESVYWSGVEWRQILAEFRPLEDRHRIRVDLRNLPKAMRTSEVRLRVENQTVDTPAAKTPYTEMEMGKWMMIFGGAIYALWQLIALLSLGPREREPKG